MGLEWKVPKKMGNGAVNARRPLKMVSIMKGCIKMVLGMEKCFMYGVMAPDLRALK